MTHENKGQANFKHEAQDFFGAQSLNENSLNELLTQTQSSAKKQVTTVRATLRLPHYAGVFGVILALLFSITQLAPKNNPAQEIADEVARNHINMKPLEIRTQSLNELRSYFTELDFSVAQSSRFVDRASNMLGARYCSIKGISAAQLRYQNPTGNTVTLYEVGYNATIFGQLPSLEKHQKPLLFNTQGVHVRLWTEKGLLMAEVENIN